MKTTLAKPKIVKVSNQQELVKHLSIVQEGWGENQWTDLAFVNRSDVERYLIYNNDSEEPFGTFEYIPYLPHIFNESSKTSIEDVFNFKDISIIKENDYAFVFEVDKLVVSKQYRSPQNLGLVIIALIEVAHNLSAKTLLTLLRPSLFRLLKRNFDIPIQQVGEKIFYETDRSWLVPALIDSEQVINKKEEYIISIQKIINDKR